MNKLDLAIFGFLGFFILKGLIKGFFHEVFGLVGLVVALITATKFMSNVAAWGSKVLDISSPVAMVLAFIVIFFVVIVFFQLLAHLFQKLSRFSRLGWLEKSAGAGVGFLKSATIVSLLLLFLSIVPYGTKLLPDHDESKLYKPMRKFAPTVFDLLMKAAPGSKSFYGEMKETFDQFSSSRLARNTELLLKTFQEDENKSSENKKDEPSR